MKARLRDFISTMSATLAATILAGPVLGNDLFSIVVDVDGVSSERVGFSTVTDVLDLVDDDRFQDVNPNYTDTSLATATIDFRGIDILARFPTAGPEVIFSIPAIGFSRTFDAQSTRDGNQQDFVDYLEANEDDLLQQILGYLVAETPIDPVAGNPSSLMSNMVQSDFSLGSPIGGGSRLTIGTREDDDGRRSVLGFAARFNRFTAEDRTIQSFTLPLSYAVPVTGGGRALLIDLPLTVVDTDGALSYATSLGVGFKVPVTGRWTLTPVARIGATGSIDLGALAAIYSASLTSNYEFGAGGWTFDIGNSVAYLSTVPIDTGDTDFNYDLNNTVIRNGVGARRDANFPILGQRGQWQLGVVNTQFYGDDLFVTNATDFSLSLATQKLRNSVVFEQLALGISYTITNTDYSGFGLNFGYKF